jgi:hypothetical protein
MTHYHKERAAELNKKERSILNPQGWEGIDKIRSDIAEYYKKCNWNMPSTRCTRNMPIEWPTEERIDNIGQNGPTGEHYKEVLQALIDSPQAIQETKKRMNAEDKARASRNAPEVLGKYQRVLTQPIIADGTGDNLYDVIIDVYDVLDAFDVSNPATAHAIKKLLCTGSRGAKDWETDLQEAIDSLERAKSFPPLPF